MTSLSPARPRGIHFRVATIPGAKNEEVKHALVNTVPTLEGHLQHAKNVQNLLASKK